MTNDQIYLSVFGNNADCYHHPKLKELVSLCLDESKAKFINKIEQHQKLPSTDTSGFYALEGLKEDIQNDK